MYKRLSKKKQATQAAVPSQASADVSAATPMATMGSYGYANSAAPSVNRTGLPDDLKSGIEALSGVSLDRVKVHYNSAAPARLRSHAYAQGQDIHLARGQEQHLPHEAWHLVQQAQGRVAPSAHWQGVPFNNDLALEAEADRMGAVALQTPSSQARASYLPTATRGVAQCMPDEALGALTDTQRNMPAIQKLIRALANARRMKRSSSMRREDTASAIRHALGHYLYLAAVDLGDGGAEFFHRWQAGSVPEFERYEPGDEVMPKISRKHWRAEDVQRQLQAWRVKKVASKSMNANRKLAGLIPLILHEPDLPDDLKIALMLFFSHTASFIPENRLGRDVGEHEHGTYFRTSASSVRAENTQLLKDDYANEWAEFPRRKTAQVLNQPLHALLVKYGSLPTNIRDADLIADDANPLLSYAVYQSSSKSGTGSLGLIQNVFRTLLSGLQVDPESGIRSTDSTGGTPVAGLFEPFVPESLLASSSDKNYHDLLLADRGALVRDTATEIKSRYATAKETGWKVIPIQSADHASLILEIGYPDGTAKNHQLEEKMWRESFIALFNTVAEEQGLQTRVTHRSSFGFLYPTISSVGTPVRIWPGLVPADVFKRLIFSTLDALATDKYEHGDFVPLPSPLETLLTPKPVGHIELHREALKSATRYAQDVMRDTKLITGPPGLTDWLSVRLHHNLLKARFLLEEKSEDGLEAQESAYLSAAGVVENLMEYSYLLEAVRADTSPMNDPYPAYLRKKLGLADDVGDKSHQATRTFYLDSGMQAIVSAHLLARQWLSGKSDSHTKNLSSIDLYSYFEYAGIDKGKLHFDARNRKGLVYKKHDGYLDMIAKDFAESGPSVISADMNPVFTSREASASQIPYADVFQHFAGKDGVKNVGTVPIVDVTNASLDKVAALDLAKGYGNFIVVESLSKYQQLGADKFTMGRLTVVGSSEFVELATSSLKAVEAAAAHRLPAAYRLRMDRVFYGGDAIAARAPMAADELTSSAKYDEFMALMGLDDAWRTLNRATEGSVDEVQKRYVAMKEQLSLGFRSYGEAIRKDGGDHRDLQKAFQSLPPLDQRHLLRVLSRELGPHEEEKVLVEQPYLVDEAINIGITNVGNTCYLAAALNMLAFSSYRDLFLPRPDDPKADLRRLIKQSLDNIVAGRRLNYVDVSTLLVSLDHAHLLEAPHGLVEHRALNAQRDPAEVLEYVLDFFGVQSIDYLLGQTINRQIDPARALPLLGGDPAGYSDVDVHGNFPAQQSADWMIKLPIAGFAGFFDAIEHYKAPENITTLTGVLARGTDQQQMYRGPGVSQISFGAEAPRVLSIQLMRWVIQGGHIRKDARPFAMPHRFALNGYFYDLKTIIYHRGHRYDGGHYTISTRGDDDQWQYRDDLRVTDDPDVWRGAGLGYLYTYERGPVAPVELVALPAVLGLPDARHDDGDLDGAEALVALSEGMGMEDDRSSPSSRETEDEAHVRKHFKVRRRKIATAESLLNNELKKRDSSTRPGVPIDDDGGPRKRKDFR